MVLLVIQLGQEVIVEMACPACEFGDSRSLCTILPGSLGRSLLQFILITMSPQLLHDITCQPLSKGISLCLHCLHIWSRTEENTGNRSNLNTQDDIPNPSFFLDNSWQG